MSRHSLRGSLRFIPQNGFIEVPIGGWFVCRVIDARQPHPQWQWEWPTFQGRKYAYRIALLP